LKLMAGAAIRMVVTSARTEAGRDSSIPSCMVGAKNALVVTRWWGAWVGALGWAECGPPSTSCG
jgi:hypothetical protein